MQFPVKLNRDSSWRSCTYSNRASFTKSHSIQLLFFRIYRFKFIIDVLLRSFSVVVVVFFFWSCVSTTLCCYLQVVPCHLRARFHIRFKRHARRVGQVRHFSMKICVLKTRAKPITKTLHENVIVNFPESARLST